MNSNNASVIIVINIKSIVKLDDYKLVWNKHQSSWYLAESLNMSM